MKPTVISRYLDETPDLKQQIEHAKSIIESARIEKSVLIKETRKKFAKLLKNSKLKAKRIGMAQGKRQAERLCLEKIIETEKKYKENLISSQNDCLALAISIAEEIISEEIHLHPETLAERMKKRIDGLLHIRKATISINPESAKQIYEVLKEKLPNLDIDLETDDSVKLGNARIQTQAGTIEVNWRDHFETISQHLQSKMQEKLR
ncbi:MAG: hypothetical protein H6619_03730 [Deltaproteobacteria bacterium]|nr:hypothetical protein [Deltaproteobacteria bacterium]